MAKKGLKWNKGAMRKLRNDPRVTEFLLKKASEIQKEAGGESMGYVVTDLVLEEPRSAVSVQARGHAHFHNRKHHSLLRALSRARD